MSWHIHSSASVYDTDAYGVDTDSPASAYELIEERLKPDDEQKIYEAYVEFREEVASWYFNTNEWDDEWWDAWITKLNELM